jgi:energy-coupling factor transport system permease protein
MHPAGWVGWVLAVMVVALATTNPFYLAVLLLAVVLVAIVAPREGTGVVSFRALVTFGLVMFGLSLVIATINGSYGDHILFTVPGPSVPEWLGGLRLGGPVSAEGLVGAAIRGLAIICILFAFGVFNGAVSPYRVLRSTPAALFQASLVVTIGLTLLPSSVEDLRRVREMRALRGAPGGLRQLPAMVVPAIVGGLERSLRLAEAMEARGYGASPPLPARARLAALASAPLLIAAAWAWFYEPGWRPAALLLFAGALLLLAFWWRAANRARRVTRWDREPLPLAERLGLGLCALVALAVLGQRFAGHGAVAYNPFAGLPLPGFEPLTALAAAALAWPAVVIMARPAASTAPAEQDTRLAPETVR